MGVSQEETEDDITAPPALIAAGCLLVAAAIFGMVTFNNVTSVDRYLAAGSPSTRHISMLSLWVITTNTMCVLTCWQSIGSLSVALLLLAIKVKPLRYGADIVCATAVALVILELVTPHIFPQTSPLGFPSSYPEMHLVTAIAFYGAILVLVRQRFQDATKYVCGLLIFSTALAAFWSLFFGYAWASDLIGGVLVGLALLLVVVWLQREYDSGSPSRRF